MCFGLSHALQTRPEYEERAYLSLGGICDLDGFVGSIMGQRETSARKKKTDCSVNTGESLMVRSVCGSVTRQICSRQDNKDQVLVS